MRARSRRRRLSPPVWIIRRPPRRLLPQVIPFEFAPWGTCDIGRGQEPQRYREPMRMVRGPGNQARAPWTFSTTQNLGRSSSTARNAARTIARECTGGAVPRRCGKNGSRRLLNSWHGGLAKRTSGRKEPRSGSARQSARMSQSSSGSISTRITRCPRSRNAAENPPRPEKRSSTTRQGITVSLVDVCVGSPIHDPTHGANRHSKAPRE